MPLHMGSPGSSEFDAFDQWSGKRPNPLSKRTLLTYKVPLRQVSAWMQAEGLCLDEASGKQLLRWVETLRATPQVRNTARKALLAYYGYLIGHGLRRSNPARNLPVWRAERKLPNPINHPGRLLGAARTAGPMIEALVVLYLYTGLRRQEVIELRWENLSGDWIYLFAKNGQHRCIFLNLQCRQALTRWQKQCPSKALLFPSSKKPGQPMSSHWAWSRIKRVGLDAGIEACRPHRLRHTFAQALYEQTGDIELVSEALGHRKLETTRIYARARPHHVRAALEQLKFPLDPEPPKG